MRAQEGTIEDRKFIRPLLLHREIGIDKLKHALCETEKAQVYRYEIVHEIIQRLTSNQLKIRGLSKEKMPTKLLHYKVKKSNVAQYEQLTGGR